MQLILAVWLTWILHGRPREDVSLDITVWEGSKNRVTPVIGDLVAKSPAIARDYALSVSGAPIFNLHS